MSQLHQIFKTFFFYLGTKLYMKQTIMISKIIITNTLYFT